jgi:hypothetical protein
MMQVRMGLRRRGLLSAQAASLPAEHRGLGAGPHRAAAQSMRVLPAAVGTQRGAANCCLCWRVARVRGAETRRLLCTVSGASRS